MANLPNDTIANLKEINARSGLTHFSSHVTADHGRPLLNEHAAVSHVPVNRIDGNRSVANYNLSRSRFWEGSISNDQRPNGASFLWRSVTLLAS